MKDPLFLTLDEVLSLHADQIRLFGGSSGIRFYDLVIGVAEGRVSKASVTVFLEQYARREPLR